MGCCQGNPDLLHVGVSGAVGRRMLDACISHFFICVG